ncbi:hypothetical protein ACKWTF_004377 [Chironomus riparius]
MDNIADHWILSAIFDRTRKEHLVESNQPEKRNQGKIFSKPNSNRFNSNVKQRRREAQSRKVTEKELTALHHKIEKLLVKLEQTELEASTSEQDECVICITSKATMKTQPCGHQVVCRRCFVKTIQSAVVQRLLPLRCVICRARINKLTSSSGTFRLQESASSYSVGSKSWSVRGSASSYSVGAASYTMGEKVPQSASLYSMSSGTSSCASGYSSGSATSRASTMSSHSSVENKLHNHNHNCSTNGCLGAIPRNSHSNFRGHKSHSFRGRIPDLPNRLPPIKEYAVRSPSRHRTPSPVNSVRFKTYTLPSKSSKSSSELEPLLADTSSPPLSSISSKKLSINNSKVAPIISKATLINKTNVTQSASITPSTSGFHFKPYTIASSTNSKSSTSANASKATSKDDKKKDLKKEEKLKQKAEKAAKKEEKRLAKEEEKLAKLRLKEERKRL